jgi:hypothetical protein
LAENPKIAVKPARPNGASLYELPQESTEERPQVVRPTAESTGKSATVVPNSWLSETVMFVLLTTVLAGQSSALLNNNMIFRKVSRRRAHREVPMNALLARQIQQLFREPGQRFPE